MTSSMKNIFINNNLSIQNPIILNNYSIQNIIISPSNLTYEKIDYNKKHIASPKSAVSSTTPIKGYLSGIIPICFEHKNLNRNITPITKFKTQTKFDIINLEDINYLPTTEQNIKKYPKIISITKVNKKEEKHPEDSIKKNLAKTKFKEIVNKQKNFYKYIDYKGLNYMSKSGSQSLERNNNKLEPMNSSSKHKIPRNSKSKSKSKFKLNNIPNGNLILKEFIFGEQIGKGTFGKIFCVNWIRNKKLYAMKKEILNDFEQVQKRIKICEMIQNIIKKTGSKGLINLYGNLYIKKLHIKKNNNLSLDDNNKEVQKNNNNIKYIYYELMEKAERDWDKEINSRSQLNLYYTQKEILDIMKQLIGVLSLLQKNHITHRDIKPQNILIINGKYKLSDYGEIRELKRDGLIVQRVRGSELYMSPILFHGLHLNILQVKHNTYKSDVFSLGMCLFYACSLTYSGVDSIREITDMNKIKEIVFQYLFKNYSTKLIYFILAMLEVDENKRLNFIQLEEKLKRFF